MMIATHPAPRFHIGRRAVSVALRTVAWVYAALWPIAAIATLAFVFSDPVLSQTRLVTTLAVVAGGSALAAAIDCRLLSDRSWWTIANL